MEKIKIKVRLDVFFADFNRIKIGHNGINSKSSNLDMMFDRSEHEFSIWHHSYKKRENSLEGSLDRVLYAAELEFLKILVPRLPQRTSDVNIECAGKPDWSNNCIVYCDQLLGALIHLNFIILILICF